MSVWLKRSPASCRKEGMSNPATVRRAAEWLLGASTLCSCLSPPAAGGHGRVFSPLRGWHPLTLGTLPLPLHYLAAALVLGVVPVAVAVALTGKTLAELGLGLGDWRAGLRWLAVGLPLAVLAGWVGAAAEPMRAVYPLDTSIPADLRAFLPYALLQFLYYGAWEVLFRGVLLFGLADRLGNTAANLSQTGLSVTAHFGRAFNETSSALPAGILFGWVTLRVRSIWCIAIIHWVVGTSCDWFILQH
jgi:membrane protease YdiL (CAAX protease family)